MDGFVWLAVAGAGVATWLALPVDGMIRLRPPVRWRLPGWATPLPAALPPRVRWALAGGVTGAVVLLAWGSTPWTLAVAPLILVATWVVLGRLEPGSARRRREAVRRGLPEALDMIKACVRAGQPLRNAVSLVSRAVGPPLADSFDAVIRGVSVGMPDTQAWQVLCDDPVMGALARDMARSAAWGTSVIDLLDQHGADLRRELRQDALTAAKAVGTSAVLPLGLCYLPAFILLGVVPLIAGGLTLFLS